MEEAITIISGNNQHWFNPETEDFEITPCPCTHVLFERAEEVKKEKRYKGHIELCNINRLAEFEEYL